MSDRKLKSGDIVRLKSGGPMMTVDRYVPHYEPAYDGEAPKMVAIGGCQKRDGEDVKCVYFPDTGGLPNGYPSYVQCHEDALQVVEP